MGLTSLDRRDSSVQSKLKCKPCGLFFKDNGIVSECEKCGGDLKRIKVHNVKIENLIIHTKQSYVGGK